jgi:single-stranded-DNA-specific exonuclease
MRNCRLKTINKQLSFRVRFHCQFCWLWVARPLSNRRYIARAAMWKTQLLNFELQHARAQELLDMNRGIANFADTFFMQQVTMNWKLKPQFDPDQTRPLAQVLSTATGAFPPTLANILMQRGVTDMESARTFLQPSLAQLHDPMRMHDMERACRRIIACLQTGERLLIYGDYDVDGTTSVSLLQLFFSDLGFEFEAYVPDRFTEGYGISFEGIEYACSTGCTLLVALDCGTKANEKIRFANEKGLEVIVVDHHQPGEELPPCYAMLNPLQAHCTYPDKSLSACALTMKLCQGLVHVLRAEGSAWVPEGYDPFARYCDLVALSIACDIVPLREENRAMLHFGLEKLRQNPLPGIAALKNLDTGARDWSVSDMVFYLGPRINSAGRLLHATEAVQLLTGRVPDLAAVAASLDAFNEERKLLDKEITEQALAQIAAEEATAPKMSTVLMDGAWSKGIIGIVASRVIETYHRPTILLTRSGGYLVGSGRSVPGFDLHEAIEACSTHLVQFGGHKYAAGLTMQEEAYPAFRAAFEAYVRGHIAETSKVAEILIDAPIELQEIDERFIRLLRRMAPFGPSNPEPNFVTSKVEVKDCTILKKDHVRFLFSQGNHTVEGIAFFKAQQWAEVNALTLDIVHQPDIKHWNGRSYVQLKVKDFKATGQPGSAS